MTMAANAAGPISIEQIEQAMLAEERDYQVLVEALKARPAAWQPQTQHR